MYVYAVLKYLSALHCLVTAVPLENRTISKKNLKSSKEPD